MQNNLKHILVLPRWYPNRTDIQLGIFIQRQLTLLQGDFKITVVYVQAITDLKRDFEIKSRHISNHFTEHIIYFKSGTGPFKKLINLNRYWKAQKIGLKKITDKIDLCHIHVPYRSMRPALKLKQKQNVPFVITEHWSGHINGQFNQKNALDKFIYRYILKKAAKISTVSEYLQQAFLKNTGIGTVVIPNYIEHQPATENVPPINTKIQLLTVGDFIDQTKNISSLIRAFRLAVESNRNLTLSIIGGGPDKQFITDLIKELNFPKHTIKLLGRQPHAFVLKAMQSCDFYICNSRHETFGMTIAEALLSGKPVISTKCGGPEEFLTPENSICIPITAPNTHAQNTPLVSAILKMADNYKTYDNPAISNTINQRFGEKTIRNKWHAFYTI